MTLSYWTRDVGCRMEVWRYQLEKPAHSALLGLALAALSPLALLHATFAAVLTYWAVGKLAQGSGLRDCVADLWIGALALVPAIGIEHGIPAGLTALAVWTPGYLALVWRRWPSP